MMRNLTASILLALLGVACTGNPVAPPVLPPSVPEAPPPLPAAPKAALSVGRGDLTLPVAIVNVTQMLFDGSRSEGDGLTYLLEFGDGASSTEPLATHRPTPGRLPPRPEVLLTAKLTVTDRHGRSDSTTRQYFLASVGTPDQNAWWTNSPREGSIPRRLFLTQDGAALSGYYTGPDSNSRRPVAGSLSDDRAIRLKTGDGAIEFIGAVELRPDPPGLPSLVLRLSMRSERVNGSVIEFEFADPY
jgi:hypothetical protein